jgi:hypothetical protein
LGVARDGVYLYIRDFQASVNTGQRVVNGKSCLHDVRKLHGAIIAGGGRRVNYGNFAKNGRKNAIFVTPCRFFIKIGGFIPQKRLIFDLAQYLLQK